MGQHYLLFAFGAAYINSMKHTKTLKVRVRDKHIPLLNTMARSVNFAWNYINELSDRAILERSVFLSDFDIQKYTQGANKEFGLHSQTMQEISREYVTRRKRASTHALLFLSLYSRSRDALLSSCS